MKNICIILVTLCGLSLSAQDKTISYGVQWGFHGNNSIFSGAMEEAHSRFQRNDYAGVALDLVARYDHNSRWMATSGLGISTYGFEFALAENYLLLQNKRNYSVIRSDFAMINIPLMIYYKFNPNCTHKKWVLGAGIVASVTERKDDSKSFQKGTEGNTNFKYLTSTTSSFGNNTMMLRFSVAREKTLRCGGLLHIGFLFNKGLTDLARASVFYTIDGQEFNHEFMNQGDFAGIRFAYFFKAGQRTFAK